MKDLFIGIFNSSGETFIQRCYAHSEKQAKMLMIRKIAKEKSMDPLPLFYEFNGRKDNFSIRKEFEFVED